MNETNHNGEEHYHFTWLDMIIIVLSVFVLVSLLVETLIPLSKEEAHLLVLIDDCICLVFLYDFFVRLYRAENKLQFMKWGWIDLVSSIPAYPFLQAGRAFRLVRLLRLLRAFRSVRHLIRHLYHSRVHGTFGSVLLVAILIVIFSSIVILEVETAPNSNIKTAEDALWWSYVTVTTVGYGDFYPVTTAGRLVAVLLMTAGVGLFGTFTAYVASWFAVGTAAHIAKQEKETGGVELTESQKRVTQAQTEATEDNKDIKT